MGRGMGVKKTCSVIQPMDQTQFRVTHGKVRHPAHQILNNIC